MGRINTNDKKRIDEYRRIQNSEIDAEFYAQKRVFDRIKRESDPAHIRATKRQKLLQTLSLAWHPTKHFLKENAGKNISQPEMKKQAIETVIAELADLVCQDVLKLYNGTISQKSVADLTGYYADVIDVLTTRANELGKHNVIAELHSLIKQKLELNNVEILETNLQFE